MNLVLLRQNFKENRIFKGLFLIMKSKYCGKGGVFRSPAVLLSHKKLSLSLIVYNDKNHFLLSNN